MGQTDKTNNPNPSTTFLFRETIILSYLVLSGTFRAFRNIAKLHFHFIAAIVNIWAPFITLKACLLFIRVLIHLWIALRICFLLPKTAIVMVLANLQLDTQEEWQTPGRAIQILCARTPLAATVHLHDESRQASRPTDLSPACRL